MLLRDAGIHPPDIRSVDDLKETAVAVQKLGPAYVLLKGGHAPLTKARLLPHGEDGEKSLVVDVLCGNGEVISFETEYLESRHTHGTGCSLACKKHLVSPTNTANTASSCHCIEPGLRNEHSESRESCK